MSSRSDLEALIRYELVGTEPVASGGCGDVWKAIDRLAGEPVAVKTLRVRDPRRINAARRSFILEAVSGYRLSLESKYVLPVRDFGSSGGSVYLVTPWLEADTGSADIAGSMGRCALPTARRMLSHASEAVGTAHASGVIHSDIAPWNILYDRVNARYVVSDFGLLRLHESELITDPSGSLLQGGRDAFLPPYARRDIGQVGKASDVYALAVTLWVMLSGHAVLMHNELVPGVVSVRHNRTDAPDAVRKLLVRFVQEHTKSDTVEQFTQYLERVPVR